MKKYSDLLEKYKELFSTNPDASINFEGIRCEIGWYDLLDDLFVAIKTHLNNNKSLKETFHIDCVKEKFGGLRVYSDGGDQFIFGLIALAADLTYKICENCGTNQNVLRSTSGWIAIRCQHCIDNDERLKKMTWTDGKEENVKPLILTFRTKE